MSRELEMLEKKASGNCIEDLDTIALILERFLNMTYRQLMGDVDANGLVARDIAIGFDLDVQKVYDLTLRDILVLIGYEPAWPYYALPEEDTWFYKGNPDKQFYTASNSFLLGLIIMKREKKEPVLEQLMHIDYRTFVKYASYRMAEAGGDITSRDTCRKGMRLNRIFYHTKKFVMENGKSDEEKDLTLSDVITTVCTVGNRGWACGALSLDTFVERTRKAYGLMKDLFMESIRMTLIQTDRAYFRSLLDRCSPEGKYDKNVLKEYADCSACYE
ncbi:MAG: hypothetical protein J5518_09870 [Lachnospiraceae bacterium]|nr:hypothetical protein [Lachnospiraceae bacterium]